MGEFQEVKGSLCTCMEDKDVDEECSRNNEYKIRVLEYMSKMTDYLTEYKLSSIYKSISVCP